MERKKEAFLSSCYQRSTLDPQLTSTEPPAPAFFIRRAADWAIDGADVAGVFEGIQAQSANHPVRERPPLGPRMQGPRNEGKEQHKDGGAQQRVEHEISERQFHRSVGC